jgi:hypothetical protein
MFRIAKPMRLQWSGHVAWRKEARNIQENLVRKLGRPKLRREFMIKDLDFAERR